jgi:hypothetical protein
MAPTHSSRRAVLLHGLGRSPVSMRSIERRLRESGYQMLNPTSDPWVAGGCAARSYWVRSRVGSSVRRATHTSSRLSMSRSALARAELSVELRAAVRAFEDAGAISPATARPLAELTGVDPTAAVALAARGIIREAVPGRYHLFAGTVHARRRRLVIGAVVLLAIVIPPIILALQAAR